MNETITIGRGRSPGFPWGGGLRGWVLAGVVAGLLVGIGLGSLRGLGAEVAGDGPPARPGLSDLPPVRPGARPEPRGEAGAAVEPGDAADEAGPGFGLNEPNLLFATTNLTLENGAQARRRGREAELEEARRMLATGRRQRSDKLYEEAKGNLVGVLNGGGGVLDELRRAALLELAMVAQDRGDLTRTLQILAQYLSRWPKDAGVPEVLLRQGLILRQMGAYPMAHSKFYATMTSALMLKDGHFDYYRRLVLQAQVEIAETLVLQGRHREAGDAFARLLKDGSAGLNRRLVQFRYIRCLSLEGRYGETVGQAREFLKHHAGADEESEVLFELVTALRREGRTQEALREVFRLLELQQGQARSNPAALAYWQQRTGNDLANQLYQEGDYVHALEVYQGLLVLSPAPAWRFPVQYQIGLAYERLEQPARAMEAYGAILAAKGELGGDAPAALKVLLDMAGWRRDFLQWQMRTEVAQRVLKTKLVPAAGPAGAGTMDGPGTGPGVASVAGAKS